MIRAYRMRLTYYDFGEYHPECATPEVLTVLENYESYMWTKAPAGLEQCAVEMGHDIHDFMRFSPSDVPQYEYYYPAFCSQLQAYSDGAPQQLPASCQATEFLENFVDAGYCQNAQEIPFVVYECLGALAEIKGSELPLFQENIGGLYAGDGYDRLVHLNNPGSFEEAFYITYLDYWEDPEVYGDWSTWPPACETTEFMDWLEYTTAAPHPTCFTAASLHRRMTSSPIPQRSVRRISAGPVTWRPRSTPPIWSPTSRLPHRGWWKIQ
jgi:hypothetical protein